MYYLGQFRPYTPTKEEVPDGMPAEMVDRIAWLKNEKGEDLYALIKTLPGTWTYVTAEVEDGSIRVVHTDPTHVFPLNAKLYGTSDSVGEDVIVTHVVNPLTRQIEVKPVPEPKILTPAEKLAAAGLSVTDLKELLGL